MHLSAQLICWHADFEEALARAEQDALLVPSHPDEVTQVLHMLEQELADRRGAREGSPRGRGRGRGRGSVLGRGALERGIQLQIEELVDLAHGSILARYATLQHKVAKRGLDCLCVCAEKLQHSVSNKKIAPVRNH